MRRRRTGWRRHACIHSFAGLTERRLEFFGRAASKARFSRLGKRVPERADCRFFTLAPHLQIINYRDCFSPIDGI